MGFCHKMLGTQCMLNWCPLTSLWIWGSIGFSSHLCCLIKWGWVEAGFQASHTAWNDMGNLKPQARKSAVQYHTVTGVSAERSLLIGKTWSSNQFPAVRGWGQVGRHTHLTGLSCRRIKRQSMKTCGRTQEFCLTSHRPGVKYWNCHLVMLCDLEQFLWPLWASVFSS